jgi:hypothetical protein
LTLFKLSEQELVTVAKTVADGLEALISAVEDRITS